VWPDLKRDRLADARKNGGLRQCEESELSEEKAYGEDNPADNRLTFSPAWAVPVSR
jgi:hypothetical protein